MGFLSTFLRMFILYGDDQQGFSYLSNCEKKPAH